MTLTSFGPRLNVHKKKNSRYAHPTTHLVPLCTNCISGGRGLGPPPGTVNITLTLIESLAASLTGCSQLFLTLLQNVLFTGTKISLTVEGYTEKG